MLKSFEVKNYRAFKRLTIKKCGQVNLIVGPNNVGKSCLLEALWLYVNQNENGVFDKLVTLRDGLLPEVTDLFHGYQADNQMIELGEHGNLTLSLTADQFGDNRPVRPIPCNFLPTTLLPAKTIAELWNNIYLTDAEADVTQVLQIIEPRLQQVGVTTETVPVVRLSGFSKPIRLANLGEGMSRLFNLALALVNLKDGVLLIDEIESGLYHAVQPQVWRFIFETAQRFNVQLFATTHSWDMLDAFATIAAEYIEPEGTLISLRHHQTDPGVVVGLVSERDDLHYITTERIEVR